MSGRAYDRSHRGTETVVARLSVASSYILISSIILGLGRHRSWFRWFMRSMINDCTTMMMMRRRLFMGNELVSVYSILYCSCAYTCTYNASICVTCLHLWYMGTDSRGRFDAKILYTYLWVISVMRWDEMNTASSNIISSTEYVICTQYTLSTMIIRKDVITLIHI